MEGDQLRRSRPRVRQVSSSRMKIEMVELATDLLEKAMGKLARLRGIIRDKEDEIQRLTLELEEERRRSKTPGQKVDVEVQTIECGVGGGGIVTSLQEMEKDPGAVLPVAHSHSDADVGASKDGNAEEEGYESDPVVGEIVDWILTARKTDRPSMYAAMDDILLKTSMAKSSVVLIRNVHPRISPDAFYLMVGQFGVVTAIKMFSCSDDDTSYSAYVAYHDHLCAKVAVIFMELLEPFGKKLTITWIIKPTELTPMPATVATTPPPPAMEFANANSRPNDDGLLPLPLSSISTPMSQHGADFYKSLLHQLLQVHTEPPYFPYVTTIFCSELQEFGSEEALYQIFRDFGPILSIKVYKTAGVGFVCFLTKEDATTAIVYSRNMKYKGRYWINCRWALGNPCL